MLDIRIPIGLMFTVLGPILVVYGLFSGPEIYRDHSLGVNVNFWWGFVLAAFGVFMLTMAYRASRKPAKRPPDS